MYTLFNTKEEANTSIELAIGRILRMGATPSQPGDIEEYERCKSICLDAFEYLGVRNNYQPSHNFVRDYYKIHHD